MKWTSEYQAVEDARTNIGKWSKIAMASVVCIIGVGYQIMPQPGMPLLSLADRLAFTLRWQIPPLGTLLCGILFAGRRRYQSRALDPVNGKDQDALVIPLKYIQNTLEQLLINTGSHLALTTYLEPHQMKLIPVLSLLFVFGRLTYWVGYHQPHLGHTNRTFGYALTLVPNIIIYCYCLLSLLLDYVGISLPMLTKNQ